ncbi:SusC/RagA family TonB-linked outer membrane protein [Flaviaesturariibacter aridisoli]|uniref:TonB-dependent receptor n=1 Tax=Flaviaesturariibacter aridisoli TaxID=2545761 RepID=A0A4R4E0P8_9BACT|nr:TonB-dependent receptor [Flaviaesturariibacter aridisoli]TCZ72936.1 TonB-dependent receptor [Flaviaesturariibacter aridisoli]
MRTHKLLLLFTLNCLFWLSADAQQREVTGRVLDATSGEALTGVSVLAEKTNTPVQTGRDGSYRVTVNGGSKSLIFSSIGYSTQTVTIGNRTVIEVQLQRNNKALDEVVVIGYGTQKKSHLTGAVSKYQNEKLDQAPVSRVDQALQGRIAGVQVQNLSSEAGSDPRIRVRGVTSLGASSDPLVVVDGHPVPDGLAFVNPADVQSVEVLKDAASAAIYGSRGSAGVILITTKSGSANRTRYNFKFSTGVKYAYQTYPMLTTTEYTNLLFYEASLRAKDPTVTGNANLIASNERAGYVIENDLLGGQATDWQSQALRNANQKNAQFSVSGGRSDLRYYLSGGYQRDQGLMYHSEYEKFNIRAKLDANLGKRVKVAFNINPSYSKREQPSVNYMDFVRFYSFLPVYHTEATAAFVRQNPAWAGIKAGDWVQARHFSGLNYSGLMPDGTMWTSSGPQTPFSSANNTPKSIMENATDFANEYRVVSSGDITINIIKGLDYKAMGSVYINTNDRLRFDKKNARADGTVNKGVFNNNLGIDLLAEHTLTYTRKLGKHNMTLLGGYTVQSTRNSAQQVTGLDFPTDDIQALDLAASKDVSPLATFSRKSRQGLNSLLGRVLYSYNDRYLFSASLRRDGSSKFAPGHKWGTFPAVSAGWVLSQEKFMEKVVWINQLKLRGSWGLTGNNRIPDFVWVEQLYPSPYVFGGGNGTVAGGMIPSSDLLANEDVTWERTFQFNTGLDLSLVRGRLNVSLDLYESKSDQLLLRPEILGITGATVSYVNIGKVRNRGIELELNSTNVVRNRFRWTSALNFSMNRNKLVSLPDTLSKTGEREDQYRNIVGGPMVQYWGYVTDGVFQSKAEADSLSLLYNASALSTSYFTAGGLKIRDLNGDHKLDQNDRTVIGNPYADFTWGINNNVTMGSFDLSFLVQGSQGGQIVNGDAGYNETKRVNRNYIDNRWISPMNPGDGRTPYSTNGGVSWVATDYMVEDASYWALRELIVGYTLPAKWTKAIRLSSARFYFTAQNLYYHFASGYRGINPEARMTSGGYNDPQIDGYQRGAFPLSKSYQFGIDVNF